VAAAFAAGTPVYDQGRCISMAAWLCYPLPLVFAKVLKTKELRRYLPRKVLIINGLHAKYYKEKS